MNEVAFSQFDEAGNPIKNSGDKGTELTASKSGNVPAPRVTPRETIDFQLTRSSDGELLEIATPLLGLCARVRSANNYDSVDELHARVKNEIQNFSTEIESRGYDKATVQAARYCMCTMVDESVMSQNWGAESQWSENTMLSIFHNETWGGEKFFAILDRVINDAGRYPDLLEFQYMCLLLGFEGKYHVAHNGASKLDHLMKQINDILLEENEGTSQANFTPEQNVVHNAKNLKNRLNVPQILLIGLALIVVVYIAFTISINSEVGEIDSRIQQTFESYRNQN